ncbi:hypothetical protein, partial [Enterobacter sp.]|uniref:hypothetical protein n=1 Tax=Enterobacter sp. TaxID=42895 RepID=UPI0039E3D28A
SLPGGDALTGPTKPGVCSLPGGDALTGPTKPTEYRRPGKRSATRHFSGHKKTGSHGAGFFPEVLLIIY